MNYYKLEFEDCQYGLEFEMNDTYGGWKKLTLTKELLINPFVPLGSGNERNPYYYDARIKYLDKEDIESFGWEDYQHSVMGWWSKKGTFTTPGGRHKLDEYKLRYSFKTKELHILAYFGGQSEGVLFEGIIKNKIELKKLLNQLNIDYEK